MFEKYINILKREVVPALGCTEPIAVALAVAKAKEVLGKNPEMVKVYVSRNILKNGMGVGIPGTGMTGLDIAAALGANGGNAEEKLEVLKNVTDDNIKDAKNMLEEQKVEIILKSTDEKLYIEAICISGEDRAVVVIRKTHSNIVMIKKNEEILFEDSSSYNDEESIQSNDEMSVCEIFKFINEIDFSSISFLLEGAKMNKRIAEEGLNHSYGLGVGKHVKDGVKKGILSDDICSYAVSLTSAASDARMAGCTYPVMSTAGSGNQGITASMPIVAVGEKLKVSEEKICRALALSNLITIHIKSFVGRLSALCGCGVAASTGACCGITYLLGGGEEHINHAIKNMVADLSGMICDGAKCGCALKISTGVSAAIHCAMVALDGVEASKKDGIIDNCVEKTIRNLATLGNDGMVETDKVILDIMSCKGNN